MKENNKNGQNPNTDKSAVIVNLISEFAEKETNNGTKIGENGTLSNPNGAKTLQKEPKKINGSNTKNGKQTEFDDDHLYKRELAAFETLKPDGYTPIDYLTTFLREVWKHRYHTLQGFQLFDGERYCNIQESDVYRLKNVFAAKSLKVTNDTLKRLTYGQNAVTIIYNPLKSYFNAVTKEYDEPTARTIFDEFVTLTYDRIDPEKTSFEHWKQVLRVWLAFSYAQIFDPVRVNDIALVFVSEAQGTGKTLIANILAAAAYELGLVGKPDFSDDIAKTARALTQNWILIDGELSRRRKADVSKFKDVLSDKTFSYVEKYEKQQTTRQRNASFLMTGNEIEYLTEISRREAIICFKENAEKEGYFTDFALKIGEKRFKNGIWAYAKYVWESEKEVVSRERESLSHHNTERSQAFLATTVERQLLVEYFVPADKNAVHKKGPIEFYDTEITDENEYITLNSGDIWNFLQKKMPSIRLTQQNITNAIKIENLGKQQNCKINGVTKKGYRVRLIKP